ncbi:MAG: metallophosphoesterase, partial [Bryobacteraceae bacterium]
MSGTRGVVLRALKWLSAAIVFLLFGLCLWGLLIGPRVLVETREVGSVANLPPEWEGKRVAFISDLQIGMWGNNSATIQRAIELLVRERPDIMLIGGDFTENPAQDEEQISASVRMVAPLVKSGIRTFAVLGNHDYSMVEREDSKELETAERLSQELTKIGIVVFNNEARSVTLREGG